MIRHVVIWNYADGFTPEENRRNAREIQSALEGLRGRIDGLLTIQVHTDMLEGCNGDILLYTEFADEASLRAYIEHPLHKEAGKIVRPRVKNRMSADSVVG